MVGDSRVDEVWRSLSSCTKWRGRKPTRIFLDSVGTSRKTMHEEYLTHYYEKLREKEIKQRGWFQQFNCGRFIYTITSIEKQRMQNHRALNKEHINNNLIWHILISHNGRYTFVKYLLDTGTFSDFIQFHLRKTSISLVHESIVKEKPTLNNEAGFYWSHTRRVVPAISSV